MADKKIYTIIINGLKESFDDTVKLTDALNKMDGVLNSQRSVVSSYSDTVKKSKVTNDELAKSEQKLADYNAERQKAIEANKAVLSDYQRVVKQQVKDENAWQVIQANVTDTYRDKQRLLTALGTVIRSYNAQTEEEKAELQGLKEQYASINTELKAFDKEMGNTYRNVGNYAEGVTQGIEASTSLRAQLRELTQQMAVLASNGQKGTEQWNKLAAEAGSLKDAIGDANVAIKKYASDSKAIDDVISVAQAATGAFGLYTSTMKLFGEENEEVAKSIEKLQAVQTALQSLQALSNTLTTDGTMANTAYRMAIDALGLSKKKDTAATIASDKATKAKTATEKVATVVTKGLSTAMKTIPIMFLIGLIMSLITYWDDLVGWMNNVIGVTKDGSTAMEKLGSVLKGVGNVVLQWLINPFKTFAKVMKKVFDGDFKGALKAATDGIKEQFNLTKHYSDAYTKSEGKNAEKRTKKNAEENAKRTKQELDELKAREGNDAKYSKKGIELQKKEFEERKKAAKGNKEELDKIKLEELNFARECEENKTKEAKKGASERTKAEKNALEEQKKLDEQYKKAVETLNNNATEGFKNELSARSKISRDVANEFADELGSMFKIPLTKEDLNIIDDYNNRLKNLSEIYKNFFVFVGDDFDTELIKVSDKITKALGEIGQDKGDMPIQFLLGFKDDIKNVQQDFENATNKIWDDANKLYEDLKIKNNDLPDNPLKQWIDSLNNDTNENFSKNFLDEYESWLKDAEIDTLNSNLKIKKIVGALYTELNANRHNYIYNWSEVQKQWVNIVNKNTTKVNDILKSNLKIDKGTLNDNLSEYNDFLDRFKEASNKLNSDGIFTKGLKEDIKTLNDETSNMYDTFVTNGSENLNNLKDGWDKYIKEVGIVYGKDSDEYLNAQKDKEKALKDFRKTAEKAQEELQKTSEDNYKKATEGMRSDVKSIGDDIIKILSSLFGDNFWEELFGDAGPQMAKAFGTGLQMMSTAMDTYSQWLDFAIEEAQEKVDVVTELYEDAVDKVKDTSDRINDINNAILNAEGKRKKELKDQLADEQLLLLQEQANEKKLQEEKEKAEKELEAKQKQQRKLELGAQMAIGIANTASAVLQTYKQWGWPLGAVFGALIGAMGAAQTAIIGKQMSKLRDGGVIGTDGVSRSHEQGGHKIEGTNIEVEGGEWVINRNSSAKYNDLLNAINDDNPTRVRQLSPFKYADGGQLDIEGVDTSLRTISVEAQMLRAIENIDMHPVVSVVDINKGQKNLARVQSYAGKR